MSLQSFVEQRPQQQIPSDIVDDLLAAIRGAFYGDLTDKQWHQEKRFLTRVVTWPARWLSGRAVTLPAERYKAIVLEILDGVKVHGATGSIKFWPGYLLRCVQAHFRVHGEDYYNEGKTVSAAVAKAMGSVGRHQVDPIEALAAANSVLSKRPVRTAKKQPEQPTLFNL